MKTKQLLIAAVAAVLLSTTTSFAQVKIGDNPTTINAGSVLELESTNKALLLPRIALTSTTAWLPLLGTPAAGMHLYNTNVAITGTVAYPTTPAKIGEYYYDGTGWVALSPVGVQTTPVQVKVTVPAQTFTAPAGTTLFPITLSTTIFDIGGNRVGNTIVAPSAGLYEFTGFVTWNYTGAISTAIAGLRVFKNGVQISPLDSKITTSINQTLSGTVIDRLAAGDVITLMFAVNGAGTYNVLGNFFSGFKISD